MMDEGTGGNVTFPEEGQFANVAASAAEPIMVLTLRDLVPDFATNLTPNNGVPSLTDPPRHRKGRPSGEMHQLV